MSKAHRKVAVVSHAKYVRIWRGKLLLPCGVLGGARRFGTHRGRRGAGHIVAAARLQLVSKHFCHCYTVAVVLSRDFTPS